MIVCVRWWVRQLLLGWAYSRKRNVWAGVGRGRARRVRRMGMGKGKRRGIFM